MHGYGRSSYRCIIKIQSKEYLSTQYDLLTDEKQRHDDKRIYRRTRRNCLRYRKPRFDNRKRGNGWFAPSIENKIDRHVDIVNRIIDVAPVTDIHVEVGKFDTQILAAIDGGKPFPDGIDYQHGPLYGHDTLREALFQRDHFTCQICGRSIKDKAILHMHHMLFWMNRHVDKLDELLTVCEKCHTTANHQPGGKLWGIKKASHNYSGASHMNQIRWQIYERVQSLIPDAKYLPCAVHLTYGTVTKRTRLDLGLEKSHINDAYCMGKYRPTLRAKEEHYQKRRRNNRCLEKFYDAKYIDKRDNKKKSVKDLSCNRTNRKIPRNNSENLRIYRGQKVKAGHRSIRRQRYAIRPGDKLLYNNQHVTAKGIHCNGKNVIIAETNKSVAITKIKVVSHVGGWLKLQ